MRSLHRQISWVRIAPQPLALIIGAGAVICLALLVAARARSDQWPYRSAPAAFTLKIEMTGYGRNTGGVPMRVETQAQRSDGATVMVDTTYNPHMPSYTFRAIRLPDGTKIKLVDAVSAKSTCRAMRREAASPPQALSFARKPPDCLGAADKLLGQTVMFGQTVDLVKTWDRGSAGEEWLAPALGCKEVQWQNADLHPDGSRRISLEGKLVSFTVGEPDARLFDLGTTYAEVKPSELLRREVKAAGDPWSPHLAEEGEREDYKYAAACGAR
jgi:hypothetical protein